MPKETKYRASKDRRKLPAVHTTGVAIQYNSPIKKRDARKSKIQAASHLNREDEKHRLLQQLNGLLAVESEPPASTSSLADEWIDIDDESELHQPDTANTGIDLPSEPSPLPEYQHGDLPNDCDIHAAHQASQPPSASPKKSTIPKQPAITLNKRWQALLPSLIEPLLAYTTSSIGTASVPVGNSIQGACFSSNCEGTTRSTDILCLYYDPSVKKIGLDFKKVNVCVCSCQTIFQVLVRHGIFPTAPSQPRMAISIDLLDFYSALFERSCDAVNAMSKALNNFYIRRGFHLLNNKGETYREPFRRGLGYAVQWHDCLRQAVESKIDNALQEADFIIQQDHCQTATDGIDIPSTGSSSIVSPNTAALTRGECSRFLQNLCPACFGGSLFGRSFEEGGDFHACMDGNFHHRHLKSSGEGIPPCSPKQIISKHFVDDIGKQIELARKKAPRDRTAKVPDAAVDDCKDSYEAANGDDKKLPASDRYDDRGWMCLVCRHDIPLFFANIDSLGEQQKYPVALILWLFKFIPQQATAVFFYDVGCVLERSLDLYDILPQQIRTRVDFATTAMHAYGHQWACQLMYNPRLRVGLGLTDGEGVERTWSRLRKLIGIVRTSSRARRIWLTDRQLGAIALDLRDDLGDWIIRRLRHGIQALGAKAESNIKSSGVALPELRQQWSLQREAQMSIRAHAPARLRKDLDTVLALQSELEAGDRTINLAKSIISKSSTSSESSELVASLQRTHDRVKAKVEHLYASLNIHNQYPEIKGVNLEFVRTLLMARDLKINIRKRAIGSFFEWDRLDQAVGGHHQALGTKLHQQTRKAIAKRAPALLHAIKKFNKYCTTLEELYNPACLIPLPLPLPTTLSELRDDPNLMEDIWTTVTDKEIPPWLEDAEVRSGIRGMLKVDRCLEERRRVGREADNLCRWFGRELSAVELACRNPSNAYLLVPLSQYHQRIIYLKARWSNEIVSELHFNSHITSANALAEKLSGDTPLQLLTWIQPEVGLEYDDEPSDPTEFTSDDLMLESHHTVDESILSDILEPIGEESELGETPNLFSSVLHSATMKWELWQDIAIDHTFASNIKATVFENTHLYFSHVLGGARGVHFEVHEITILNSPTAFLNDVCINGLSTALQLIYASSPDFAHSSNRCAVLSTFDLLRARYNDDDDQLWKNLKHTQYWEKDVWILPIHRARHLHWVLCVIYPKCGEFRLYDSFASQAHWTPDVTDISRLISRMASLANRFINPLLLQRKEWVAQPVIVEAVQTNSHDCGLWVLSWVAAVLRGFDVCGAEANEMFMPHWRAFLAQIVRSLLSST